MKIKDLILCALFAAFISISAMFSIPIPFTPIPITLQVMAVFVSACVLGKKRGSIAVIVYILLGAFGLPVFSGLKGGISVIAGATGGYIIGMIPAAYVTGAICEFPIKHSKRTKYILNTAAMFLGLAIIYAFGTAQLMFIANLNLASALSAAVIPFVFGDVCKIIIALVVSSAIKGHLINLEA